MIKRITGNVFTNTMKSVSKLKTNREEPIEVIHIKTSEVNDLFVREINPKLRAREEARKILLEAKIEKTPENLYCSQEVNDFLRRTPINTDADLSLFKILHKSDTPAFSLEDISLIMNAKKQKKFFVSKDPMYKTMTKKLMSGNEFTDIIISSKINNFGNLMGQGIKDNIIAKNISDKVIELMNTNEIHYDELIGKLDNLIDLVGIDASARGMSCSLTGESYKYTRLKYGYADHDKVLQDLKQTPIKLKPQEKSSKFFKNDMELDCLKSYLMHNTFFESEISKYLYETYYLPRLSPKPRAICKKISDEFGTKVFVENTSRDKAATMLYDEFCEWQRASTAVGKDFVVPPIFDLSRYKTHYAIRKSGGYTSYSTNEISLRSDKHASMVWGLRHEMVHLNCNQHIVPGKPSEAISLWLNDESTIENFVLDNQYTKELFNAGLPQQKIRYAHTNEDEFLAVAGEGDYSRYSAEFKELLIKLGMPEFVFSMRPGNPEFVANANKRSMQLEEKIAKIQKQYPDAKVVVI